MSTQATTITLSPAELDTLIRRAVQEAVQAEFARLLERLRQSPLEDWGQEGPDDPQGDAQLLAEALSTIGNRQRDSSGWQDWDEFKADFDRE